MDIKAGSADQSVSFAAFTTTTGAAVTVTSATAGLSLWYRRGTAGAKTAITPIDLATLETAHTDGGILVVGGQEHRLDLPDAAVAAGVDRIEWGGEATGITIDGGSCNLIGQATTGSVGTPLTSVQTQAAAAAAIAAAGLSPSSGARTCVLTVDDGTDPLESASVRVTKGAESYVLPTNSSGEVTFNLDDGTWTVAITLAGYVFAGDSLVVNGDESETYSMTANGSVPAPSTTAQCTGYGYVYDQAGAIESGVVIVSELTRMPSGSAKIGDDDTRNATSAADGLVTFANLWIGGTYRFYRSGSSKRFAVTIDAADVDSEGRYPLPNFVG